MKPLSETQPTAPAPMPNGSLSNAGASLPENPHLNSPALPISGMSENSALLSPAQVSEAEARIAETKRGRGRPRKDGLPVGSGPSRAPRETVASASPAIPMESFAATMEFPYAMAAEFTGFQGFLLPEGLAMKCAPHLKVLADHYAPQVSPVSAAWFALASTLLPHTISAAMGYADFKKAEAIPSVAPENVSA